MLFYLNDLTRFILRDDFVARGEKVDATDRFVVFAHVVVALGAAAMVIKRNAGADHVDKGCATVSNCTFDQGHELVFVARETAANISGT